MGVLMRLFRLSFVKSKGLNLAGEPDNSLTEDDSKQGKQLIKEIVVLIQLLVKQDASLQ